LLPSQIAQDEFDLVWVALGEHFAEAAFAVFFAHEISLALGVDDEAGEVIRHAGIDLPLVGEGEGGFGFLAFFMGMVFHLELGD